MAGREDGAFYPAAANPARSAGLSQRRHAPHLLDVSRRHEKRAARGERQVSAPQAEATCPLCLRPIPPGARASRHHLTPRLKGGTHRGTVLLHHICHQAIHARFTETELARRFTEPEALRAEPRLTDFLGWVATKPPEFHAPTRTARDRTPKWR